MILHICYGESFLVPAGAWLCGSLMARARRSPTRVRLPPAHFARRSGKIYLSFGYFLLVRRSFKRKDGILPCRFDSYAPTRNCEVRQWLRGYGIQALALVSYALLAQLGERTAVKRGRHWFESNTERFDSVLLGSES